MTKTTSRYRSQAGASLMLALAVIAILTIVAAGLTGFLTTSMNAETEYRKAQDLTYASDGAIKAAINWAATQDVGRDPTVYPDDPNSTADDCVFRDASKNLTITCAAAEGSRSGVANETGLVPANAITLLGQRYGEHPLFSPCTGGSGSGDRTSREAREVGLLIDARRLKNDGTGQCERGSNPTFVVAGDIVSNAPIVANGGTLKVTGSGSTISAGTSPIYGNQPCKGLSADTTSLCSALPLKSGGSRSAPVEATNGFDPKEQLAIDPARGDQVTASQYRIGDINWNAGKVSINGGTPVVADSITAANLATCTGSTTDLVRFYPGVYRQADKLNQIFGSNCKNGVFWFLPAANSAQRTTAVTANYNLDVAQLTAGNAADRPQQGVFVFDFTNTTGGTNCAALTTANANHNPHRWCLGVSPSSVVVGGWPNQWDPVVLQDAPNNSTEAPVVLTYASTLNDNGSRFWTNQDGARTTNANDATYRPGTTLGVTNPSGDRSITLGRFWTSQTGSVPLAVASGTEVSISVTHREYRAALLDNPRLEIATLDESGQRFDCGIFSFPKSVDSSDPAARQTHVLSTVDALNQIPGATANERLRLRDCFSSPERISNATMKWLVSGDSVNSGGDTFTFLWWTFPRPFSDNPPQLALDGIKVELSTPTGSWFGPNISGEATYCDDEKPGVQFIFGGDSTVHVGSSALQLCAGPPPEGVDSSQQIAVWGMPQNYEATDSGSARPNIARVGKSGSSSLLPSSATHQWQCDSSGIFTWTGETGSAANLTRALRSGEVYTDPGAGGSAMIASINPGNCQTVVVPQTTTSTVDLSGFGDLKSYATCDNAVDICFNSATQDLSKVELKITYSTNCGTFLGWSTADLFGCPSGAGGVEYKVMSSSGTEWCSGGLPKNITLSWYAIDVTACLNSVARINDARVQVKFKCNWCIGGAGPRKELDGAEIVVTTKPKGVNAVTPATGCRTSLAGYGSGFGDNTGASGWYLDSVRGGDCALISGGRVNIQGTIYAPSDALEVNDADVVHPFATRGLIARHLRVRQYQPRSGFNANAVTNVIDDARQPRMVVFTSCSRATASSEPCGTKAGDILRSRALVAYEQDPDFTGSVPTGQLRVPNVISHSNLTRN